MTTPPRLYARKRIELEMRIARSRIAFQEGCFGSAHPDDYRWLATLTAERRLTFTWRERVRAWLKGRAL